MQCLATTAKGTQCKREAATGVSTCVAHNKVSDAAMASNGLTPLTDDGMNVAPINSEANVTTDATTAPQDAPINSEANVTTDATTAPQDVTTKKDSEKDMARIQFEKRQIAKRQAIKNAPMTTAQKETARAILTSDDSAVNVNVKRDDNTIMAFDVALASGAAHVNTIKPADYDIKPRWLSEKDFKKAKRSFNLLYATQGESAFERDADGRLIMPLPMTAGRYMGCVISGDIVSVLRFSGAWKASADGTFHMLAAMDGVAPLIAAVYRAGAMLSAAAATLDKAQIKLDASDSDKLDSLTAKRDLARITLDKNRDSFVTAYLEALRSQDAQQFAIEALESFVKASKPADQTNEVITDLVA